MRLWVVPILLAGALLADEPRPLPEGASLDIVVQDVQGEVDVQADAKAAWTPAAKGTKLAPGARVCTGIGGQALLAFGANSVAIVSEATMFEIRSFGMKGDELVAEAYIDPGIAHVSVKQVEQFQTDFQVSTPRLTCSIRGSAYTVVGSGDEVLDTAECNEHLAEVLQASGQGRTIVQGAETNSANEAPENVATRDNVVDITSPGSPDSERRDAGLLALLANTIANNLGDLNLGTNSSPSNGTTILIQEVVERCDALRDRVDLDFLIAHGFDSLAAFLQDGNAANREAAQAELDEIDDGASESDQGARLHEAVHRLLLCHAFASALADRHAIQSRQEAELLGASLSALDVGEHIRRDASTSFQGGIEGQVKDEALLFARENGFPSFVANRLIPYLNGQFALDPEGLQATDPQLFSQRLDDFRTNEFGLNDLAEFLAAADQQARNGFVDPRTMGDALSSFVHAEFHLIEYAAPAGQGDGQYDREHDRFHQDLQGLTNDLVVNRFDLYLAHLVSFLDEAWRDRTDCRDNSVPSDPCFDPRIHLEDRLLDTLRAARGATGTMGFGNQTELDAIHAFIDLGDVRRHISGQDVLEFQARHDRTLVETELSKLVGLAAVTQVFESEENHEDFHDRLSSLEQSDPAYFRKQHDDFHDVANFGLDAFDQDWQAVAAQARAQAVDPDRLGHALLDFFHTEAHGSLNNEPEAQYDADHAALHAQIDALHATLSAGGLTPFLDDFADALHQAWHNETGVPLNPNPQAPGFDAHEHFHAELDQLKADVQATVQSGPR